MVPLAAEFRMNRRRTKRNVEIRSNMLARVTGERIDRLGIYFSAGIVGLIDELDPRREELRLLTGLDGLEMQCLRHPE